MNFIKILDKLIGFPNRKDINKIRITNKIKFDFIKI